MQSFENKASKSKTILLTAFVAGTLDIVAATLVYGVIMQRATALEILSGIAAGLFGKTVIGNETVMAVIGLILHYFIAFCFTGFYFFVSRYMAFLRNNAIISGLLYGIFVWMVMNLVVLPLSQAYNAPFTWPGFLRSVVILMLCIGLPISLMAAKYYKHANVNTT